MINRKRKGSRYELLIANQYRAKGWYVMKSAASLGYADLIAIKPDKSLILLIQCKKGKLSVNAKYKALLPLKALEGYYKVEALLV